MNNSLGFASFVVSASVYTTFRAYFGSSDSNFTIDNISSRQNATVLRRNESEFSLGLSRSMSVNKDLTEFGKMCDSGQIFMMVATMTFRVSLGSFLAYKIWNSFDKK